LKKRDTDLKRDGEKEEEGLSGSHEKKGKFEIVALLEAKTRRKGGKNSAKSEIAGGLENEIVEVKSCQKYAQRRKWGMSRGTE